jgi:hypothetical protein
MAKRDGYATLMIEVPEALHATIKEVADEAGVPMKTPLRRSCSGRDSAAPSRNSARKRGLRVPSRRG